MRKHLLAIDDSKPIRFLLHTVFKKDYQVTTVPDGYSALYFLQNQSNHPDLIIVDAELPDMQQWEFLEHLTSSSLYNHIPFIVLSNLDEENTKMNCIRLGALDYFKKPFNPVEMIDVVNKALKVKVLPMKSAFKSFILPKAISL